MLAGLPEALRMARDAGLAANAGVLRGGTAINVIAAEAVAELDLRSKDDRRLRGGAELVSSAFAQVLSGLEFELTELGHRPGGRLAPDHELLVAARGARAQVGLPPAHELASSTDANAAHGRGVPAITIGITTGAHAHRTDEYIDLEPICAGLAALDALVDRLAY